MKESAKDLLVLGSGGFAQEVADIARTTGEFLVRGFVEGVDKSKCGEELDGAPILWIEELADIGAGCHLICAVGSTKRHSFISQAEAFGLPFTSIIHPDASISSLARVEAGVVINAKAVVSAHSHIDEHTILNRGALIGHHCQIGKVNTISPGVNIGGYTSTGAEVFIGIGAVVFDHLKIGEKAVIRAAALVRKDVPARTLIAANPSKAIKTLGP